MHYRVVPTRSEATAVRFDGSRASYEYIQQLFPSIGIRALRLDAENAVLDLSAPHQYMDLPKDHWLAVDGHGHCSVWTDAEFGERYVPLLEVDRG